MIRRFLRLLVLAGAAAAAVAVIRGRGRQDAPLPSPASEPSGPWPPLRNESPVPPDPADDAVSVDPDPTPPDGTVVVPEPDGVPVADTRHTAPQGAPWVEPDEDGGCPPGHPVKAKMSSKIFHLPGQLNYDRTTPDRCYVDAAAAEADGLRAAKR